VFEKINDARVVGWLNQEINKIAWQGMLASKNSNTTNNSLISKLKRPFKSIFSRGK
jgi:hypothetical protein